MVVYDRELPDPYFETEPCVLVEVLSPNTKHIDVREKMLKRLPSLWAYLIVNAASLFVRHLWRDEEDIWQQDITSRRHAAALFGQRTLPITDLPERFLGVGPRA